MSWPESMRGGEIADGEYDESSHQASMVDFLQTEHSTVHCGSGTIAAVFPEVVWHTEKPLVRTAPAPLYLLSRLVNDNGYKVVLTGEDGREVILSVLGEGDFFGEISLLLGEPPVADVVAVTPVKALQLAGPELREFLLAYPQVMYRMLQAVSRRLDRANRRS